MYFTLPAVQRNYYILGGKHTLASRGETLRRVFAFD